MKLTKTLKGFAISTSVAGLLALGSPALAASGNLLDSEALPNGYSLTHLDAEGKCGGGSCGAKKGDKKKKDGEGKCGADKDKDSKKKKGGEKTCGEGTCG